MPSIPFEMIALAIHHLRAAAASAAQCSIKDKALLLCGTHNQKNPMFLEHAQENLTDVHGVRSQNTRAFARRCSRIPRGS